MAYLLSVMTLDIGWQRIRNGWRDGRGRGLLLSLILHGLAAYLVLTSLPGLFREFEEGVEAIPVELVGPRDMPGAPGNAAEAAPDKAAKGDAGRNEPVANPAPAVAPRKEPPSPPDIGSKPHARTAKPAGQPLAARTTKPHQSREMAPASGSGASAGSGTGGPFDVKDFLRAQIERRWEFDVAALGKSDIVVSLHLRLDPDGAVRAADIVDDPRYQTSPTFKSVADSARRAALVASPFQIPVGKYGTVNDITVDLSPKDALQ